MEGRSEERDAGASGALEENCLVTLMIIHGVFRRCLSRAGLRIVAGFIYVPVRLRK